MRIKEVDGEVIDYYQPHVEDYFNEGGVTYIKFDDSFANGKFKKKADQLMDKKSLDTHNLYYRDETFLNDLAWL